jgi:HEPN domain-containing protein
LFMKRKPTGITAEWLSKAESDLTYAQLSFDEFDDFYTQICILCHDSSEKFLKGFLQFNNVSPKKIHDISTLLHECLLIKPRSRPLRSLEQQGRLLNTFYTPLKYPSHYPPVERSQAQKALQAATYIAKTIKKLLGEMSSRRLADLGKTEKDISPIPRRRASGKP